MATTFDLRSDAARKMTYLRTRGFHQIPPDQHDRWASTWSDLWKAGIGPSWASRLDVPEASNEELTRLWKELTTCFDEISRCALRSIDDNDDADNTRKRNDHRRGRFLHHAQHPRRLPTGNAATFQERHLRKRIARLRQPHETLDEIAGTRRRP